MVSRRLAALALILAGTVFGNGCGTGAVDVSACRQVEEARCHQAPACNIVITPPDYTGGSDVDACVRYYDDACLHGLVAGGPSASDLSACVTAITTDSNAQDCCSTVKEPQTSPACRWLDPAPTDASGVPPSACD
jgi:hypothetical protein